MANTWIVLADGARARIFAVDQDEKAMAEIKEILHPESRSHERDLITDGPGFAFDSAGPGRHPVSQNESPKKHEAMKLCKELAEAIELGRAKGQFGRLVIAAAPAFLGDLRKKLHPQTVRLVTDQLNKDLVHLKPDEIRKHLPDGILN